MLIARECSIHPTGAGFDHTEKYEKSPFSHPIDIKVTSKRILSHWVQPSSDAQDLFVLIVVELAVGGVGEKPNGLAKAARISV
jgi:hypothetical protein